MNGTKAKSRLPRKPRFADALVWVFGILRPDWDRLAEGETAELDELLGQAAVGGGFDWGALSKRERDRLEGLVGKVGGVDFAAERRREAEIKDAKDKEAMRVRRPFTREETTNFFRAAFEAMEVEDLWIDDVQVLVAILATFAAGKTLVSTAYFEGEGDDLTLCYDNNYGLLGNAAASGSFDGWTNRLPLLNDEGWLECRGRGPQRAIKLGPRLREALAGTPSPVEETAA